MPGPGIRCRSGRTWSRRVSGSPGVVLGGRLVSGEYLIQPSQRFLVELDVQRPQCPLELLLGARADDRRGDRGLRQQPGEGNVTRLVSQLVHQVLILLDLVPVRL